MSAEFDIIRDYFASFPQAPDVLLGIGDDAAMLHLPAGEELVVTVDTLVEGVHFFAGTDADAIAHKSLAVNLSDLAAMGATPRWFTLALTMPQASQDWLSSFATGLRALAVQYGVTLVGGDTTQGPLSITIQALGTLPSGQVIKRSGARPGDVVFLSGNIGDAGLALAAMEKRVELSIDQLAAVKPALLYPNPRVKLGEQLRQYAHAMIDCSDGFAADLGHILEQSHVGASIRLEQLPLSAAMKEYIQARQDWSLPLTAGDDYELIFTASPQCTAEMDKLSERFGKITAVGEIIAKPGLQFFTANGNPFRLEKSGYQHFD